jgi:hypothetical protein
MIQATDQSQRPLRAIGDRPVSDVPPCYRGQTGVRGRFVLWATDRSQRSLCATGDRPEAEGATYHTVGRVKGCSVLLGDRPESVVAPCY